MTKEIHRVLNLSRFFKIRRTTDDIIEYSLMRPSTIIMKNIHHSWLQSVHEKLHKNVTVYLNQFPKVTKIPYGLITPMKCDNGENAILTHNVNKCAPEQETQLKLNLVFPEQDFMQSFIQWQRYRKYWWSSITTSPSLFGIDDIKYGDNTADVNIVAKFPFGQQTVETVTMSREVHCTLSCTIALEHALIILLLDGLHSSTEEGYLRLHRNMTPYKISFAVESEDTKKQETLRRLATVLHHRLQQKQISAIMPNFETPMLWQITGNLQLGVAYTAVLNETTLANGIFNLLNSSTMTKEQIHVADFESYASLLCGKRVKDQ